MPKIELPERITKPGFRMTASEVMLRQREADAYLAAAGRAYIDALNMAISQPMFLRSGEMLDLGHITNTLAYGACMAHRTSEEILPRRHVDCTIVAPKQLPAPEPLTA